MAENNESKQEEQKSQLETILENQEKLAQQYEQYYEDLIAKLEKQMEEKGNSRRRISRLLNLVFGPSPPLWFP